MKYVRTWALFAVLLALCSPVAAQWQAPNHSVPVGRGSGATGFSSALPGAAGRPLISNGGTVDPLFGVAGTNGGGTGADNSTNSAGDLLTSNGTNGSFVHTALNAMCSILPSACTQVFGFTRIGWYGAKCDAVYSSSQNAASNPTTLTIGSGSTTLLSTGSVFTSADAGKSIWVPGAGVAGVGLSTTISAFVDASHVVLATGASTAVTTFTPTNASPFVYGTDDTTAIQAAFAGTPVGGVLYISAQTTGCLIKQQGANTYSLLQDHPFSIRGSGRYSTLMTDPSIPATVDNIRTSTGQFDWSSIVWEGFSIGDAPSWIPFTAQMYTRHGKRGLALVDNASFTFINTTIRNVQIGESGNDYSVYMGNGTSSPSTNNLITESEIWGGIRFQLVSDSNRIFSNRLLGTSTFGGSFEFVVGSGRFDFMFNNVTWTGGTHIESGIKITLDHNYFEELFATTGANNAMVDWNGGTGTITAPSFEDNIVNAAVSSTSTPVRYNNVGAGGVFGKNVIITSTARTGVASTVNINCSAPNTWIGVGTHFSTALASPNPFAC